MLGLSYECEMKTQRILKLGNLAIQAGDVFFLSCVDDGFG